MVVKYLRKIVKKATSPFVKTKVAPLNSVEDLTVFQISGMDGRDLSKGNLVGEGEFTTTRSDIGFLSEDRSSIASSKCLETGSTFIEDEEDGFLLESIKSGLQVKGSSQIVGFLSDIEGFQAKETSPVAANFLNASDKLEIAHKQLARSKDSSEEVSVRKVSHASAIDLYKQVFILGSSEESSEAAMGLRSAYAGVRDKISPGEYTDFIIPYDNIKLNFWKDVSKLTGEIDHELSCELSNFASRAKLMAILKEQLPDSDATERNAESFHNSFDQDYEAIATALILRKLGINSLEYSVNDLLPYLDAPFEDVFLPSHILGEYFNISDDSSSLA